MSHEVNSSRMAEPGGRAVARAIGLVGAERLAELRQPNDRPGLVRLAGHLVVLLVSGAGLLLAPHWTVWLAFSLVYGIALVFLFTLEHETIHGSAFRSDWINHALSTLAGVIVVVPARWFRYFHFAHHRHTQDPGRDPELATPKPRGWFRYAIYLTALPYWCSMARTLVAMALGRVPGDYVPAARRGAITSEARVHLALYIAVAVSSLVTGSLLAVELWLVPLLLGQPFLRAYLLAEHGACALVADMLDNSRTTFAGRAVRFIAWNMPYHTAHHAFPTVPFHRLPELTALIRGDIGTSADDYLDAHRQIRAGWERAA